MSDQYGGYTVIGKGKDVRAQRWEVGGRGPGMIVTASALELAFDGKPLAEFAEAVARGQQLAGAWKPSRDYPCCDHCDHQEADYEPSQWRHQEPCPSGCDAEDEAEELAEVPGSDVSETGEAFDVHGRRIAVGHDEGAVYLDTGLHRYLYDASEREQFMKAWAEAERRAEAPGAAPS